MRSDELLIKVVCVVQGEAIRLVVGVELVSRILKLESVGWECALELSQLR